MPCCFPGFFIAKTFIDLFHNIFMQVLFFLTNLIFILYFVVIGVWRLGAIPLIAMLALVFGGTVPLGGQWHAGTDTGLDADNIWSLDTMHEFFTSHALVIAWSLVVLWWWGLVDIYADLWSEQVFWLVWLHIVLRLCSYLYNYKDGIQIFHVWYYLSLLLLLYQMRGSVDAVTFVHLVMAFLVMTMAIYGFIVFCLWAVGKQSTDFDKYMLFVLFNICVIILIYLRARDDLPSAVILSQIYMMAVYVVIYGIKRYYRSIKDEVTVRPEHLVEEILAGKQILTKKIPFLSDMVMQWHHFLSSLNKNTTFSISFMNVVLVLFQVYLFVRGFGADDMRLTQGMFRFGVAAFFVNYLLLREIWFYHKLQRAVAFVLINLGIYLSIIHAFGNQIFWLVLFGVGRSILNSILIFASNRFRIHDLLQRQDYLHWIGTNAVATLINLYFIARLPLSGQFRFSLIFLYIGVQFVLVLYTLRYVNQVKKPTDMTIEQRIDTMIQQEIKK